MISKVKWFNDNKGFGFIIGEPQDIFLHYTELQGDGFKSVKEGAVVEFTLHDSAKGPVAKCVTIMPEEKV